MSTSNNVNANQQFINQNRNLSGNKPQKNESDKNSVIISTDLPLIEQRKQRNKSNKSNNCNINKNKMLKHCSIKKIVFNPISSKLHKKLKESLLSPISPLSKNKNYSNIEIKQFSKRKFRPLNINRIYSENKYNFNSSHKNFKNISTYMSSSNNNNVDIEKNNMNKDKETQKNHNLDLINLLMNYRCKKCNDTKDECKCKYITNNKHIQEFKKSIMELYNKIGKNQKKYLNNINFVHCYLYNNNNNNIYPNSESLPNIKNMSKSYEKNTHEDTLINKNLNNHQEIEPKFEYIDFFGTPNKIITKLTTNYKINNNDKNDFKKKSDFYNDNNKKNNELNSNLELHKNLRYLKSIALKDTDEYKNRNYIKKLQKKKTKEKALKEEILKQNGKENVIELSRKGFDKLRSDKIRNFSHLINNTIKKHNIVTKKLNEIIELNKQNYIKEYSKYGTDLNIKKEEDKKTENENSE